MKMQQVPANSPEFLELIGYVFSKIRDIRAKAGTTETKSSLTKGMCYHIAYVSNEAIIQEAHKFELPDSFALDVMRNFSALVEEVVNGRRSFFVDEMVSVKETISDFLKANTKAIYEFEHVALSKAVMFLDMYMTLKCQATDVASVLELELS